MRKRIVAANWKMNGSLQENAARIDELLSCAGSFHTTEVVLFVPFPYLLQAAQLVAGSPIRLGAQNVSEHGAGAYTGEVSGAMLRDVGCQDVLIGHSERRHLYHESNDLVAAKIIGALACGLRPVLCLGETLAERQAGATERVVAAQLNAVLTRVDAAALADAVLAYEPVWAIGTGQTASVAQAQAVHAFIRAELARSDTALATRLPILYGGSVKSANAASLFAAPDIDGGLVGGASLDAKEFCEICRQAENLQSSQLSS